jgi:hypothetical protein
MPVRAATGQDPYAGPTVIQGAPGSDPAQTAWNPPPGAEPVRPSWNQPMPEPPGFTPPAPPSAEQPTLLYGQQQLGGQPPAYTPPGYTPQPPQPAYGQPQQSLYGQPRQPQKKSRAGCVVSSVLALVLVVVLLAAGFLYLRNQSGGLTIGGATIGGNTSSGPGVIYQDALNGSTKDKWANDSNCFFGSGGYHINAAFICYAPADTTGDAVTTVTVSQISGPITYPYGLVIRRVSKGNYYEFLIDANGKWLFDKVVNGTSTDIVKFTADKAIKTGLNQSNTISVQAKGSHFVFSVNGTQVGTADDSTFPSGETGLSGNDNIEVVYTNLVIKHVA